MKNIKAVFFDLDHTLWDFESNSRQTIGELVERHGIQDRYGIGFSDFMSIYERINHSMWSAYSLGQISKDRLRSGRFALTLEHFGVADGKLAEDLSSDYVRESPLKTNLFPYVHEILAYLRPKYKLGLITNGFVEVQQIKIRQSKLEGYFDEVIISEQVGFKKPDPTIFLHAASLFQAHVSNCVMVGDNLETDIKGAMDAGMDAFYFNTSQETVRQPDFTTISCLSEIKKSL
ncbi:MAG: YjjG family noncanonical pyrimidine nucleotidase [Bacteroidota bacterium]